jgi:hypothetical protein
LAALGTRQNPGAPHRFPVKDPARPAGYRASLVRVLMKSGRPWHTADAERAARTPTGMNVAVGAAAVVAAALVAAAVPAVHEVWRWEAVAAAVAVTAALTVDGLAMAVVVPMAWLVSDGFLENRLGQLTWHGSTDLSLILLLSAAAGFGLGIGRVGQLRRGRQIRGGRRRRRR